MSVVLSANRVRLFVVIALLAVLALGSFWVLEVMRRDAESVGSAAPKGEPDYTVEKFSFVRMSQTGQARYNISGARLTHYPDSDSFEIQQPVLHDLSNGQAPLTLHAERAIVEHVNNRIHMYDNVQMDRPASPKNEHFHLESEYLLILPDDDIVQTDKPVAITFDTSHLTGIGMFLNNATREFRLSHNVRGTYRPAIR